MVILRAKLDVRRDDGDLDDSEDVDRRDDAEEAEDVVEARFVLPDAAEEEEELDEYDGEGDEARKKDGVDAAAGVPRL